MWVVQKGSPAKCIYNSPMVHLYINHEPAIEKDSLGEAVKAEFIDVNDDGKPDLYIAMGGYGFNEKDPLFQDHIYINDGNGNFISSPNALPPMLYSKGCVKAADINGDGAMDLFVGGRVVPGKYPVAPQSMILLNDGKGHFRDATKQVCPELADIGMVTDAVWVDLNGDKQPDLVVVGEWMPIKVFHQS